MNAEITGEIPHIDGGQSPGHSGPCHRLLAVDPLQPNEMDVRVVTPDGESK